MNQGDEGQSKNFVELVEENLKQGKKESFLKFDKLENVHNGLFHGINDLGNIYKGSHVTRLTSNPSRGSGFGI